MNETTRRNLLGAAAALPFAALPAVAHAAPITANDVPLLGTDEEYIAAAQRLLDTMPAEDAALIQPGREWIVQFRAVLDANQYLADLAEARPTPPPPEALFWRESDAELDVKSYYFNDDGTAAWAHRPLAAFASVRDADGRTWFAPDDICVLGETHLNRPLQFALERGENTGMKFERKVQRIRELLDAKDEWNKAINVPAPAEQEAEQRYEVEVDRLSDMESAMAQTPPHTLSGLMLKAVVAARYVGKVDDLPDYPDHLAFGSVVRDLVTMALGNVAGIAA